MGNLAKQVTAGVGGALQGTTATPPISAGGSTPAPTGNPNLGLALKAAQGILEADRGQLVDIGGGYMQQRRGNPVLGALGAITPELEKRELERKRLEEKEADRRYMEAQRDKERQIRMGEMGMKDALDTVKRQEARKYEQDVYAQRRQDRLEDQERARKLDKEQSDLEYSRNLGRMGMERALDTVEAQRKEKVLEDRYASQQKSAENIAKVKAQADVEQAKIKQGMEALKMKSEMEKAAISQQAYQLISQVKAANPAGVDMKMVDHNVVQALIAQGVPPEQIVEQIQAMGAPMPKQLDPMEQFVFDQLKGGDDGSAPRAFTPADFIKFRQSR